MTDYQPELVIDCGDVGDRFQKHPFKVRLDASLLTELIRHASIAHRVYELMLITRPGDVWTYVTVTPERVPPGVAERIKRAWDEVAPEYERIPHPWPDDRVPLLAFDKLFYWSWDDTLPEDEAWLRQRGSSVMYRFGEQLLAIVRTTQAGIGWNDHLIRHVLDTIKTGRHPYGFLDRHSAIKASNKRAPNPPTHTQGFYKQLNEALNDPELVSIAYRANGDYKVLRMLATEQRSRAKSSGHLLRNSLYINALTDLTIDNEAWDSEIHFFGEGLGHGDLYIQGPGIDSNSIKNLIENHHRRGPGRYILSYRDEGDIPGFSRESGEGWWFYRRDEPENRRRCMERIYNDRLQFENTPMLAFEGQGGLLFLHEKTVIIVSADISLETQTAVASLVHDWQVLGGNPLVVVCGNADAFVEKNCHDILQPPVKSSGTDSEHLPSWLRSIVRDRYQRADAIILINPPTWFDKALMSDLRRPRDHWPVWVVGTPDCTHLSPDLVLDGLPDDLIGKAHGRAQRMRIRA
jgi:hypothetical protein